MKLVEQTMQGIVATETVAMASAREVVYAPTITAAKKAAAKKKAAKTPVRATGKAGKTGKTA